jgi:cyanophycinase-like exopeptidase
MTGAFLLVAALAKYAAGSTTDVHPTLHGPVLDLAGSSAETHGLQAMVDAVRGCTDCDATLDVVIIRASGDQGLNPVFMGVKGVNSAVSYVITDRESGNRRDVADAIDNAEIVWFAGGDQCNYIRWIKGTRSQRAVERLFKRNGGIGGNSAGLAIQGDAVYDSCPDVSAQSKDVLLNPFHRDVSLSSDFFRWAALKNTITDTHFHQRDRFGRTLVFLARTYARRHRRIDALGVDEQTSVVVTPDGKGVVYGPGAAYLVVADHRADTLKKDTPLTYHGFKVWKFSPGDTIDFLRRPTTDFKSIDVVDGVLSGDPY